MKFTRKLCKFISLLAALLLISSGMTTGFAATADNQSAADNTKLVERLYALGLIEKSDADLAAMVTRGEYAKLLVRYLNLEAATLDLGTTPYIDVSINSEYVREIKLLHDLEYIDSDKYSNRYYPDRVITIAEAADMMLRALGYGFITNTSEVVSARARVLKGISGGSSDEAALLNIYQLFENCNSINCIVWDGDAIRKDSRTALEAFHYLRMETGVVTANEYTSLLSAAAATQDGYLEIDHAVYKLDYKYGTDMLGMKVKFYVDVTASADTGVGAVRYIESASGQDIYELDAEDVSITGTSLEYTDEQDKSRVLNIGNADVIYNNQAYAGFGALTSLLPANGYIRAIDNDGDGGIDVLMVTDYYNVVVSAVDAEQYLVHDRLTKQALNLEDARVIDVENAKLSVTDIAAGDILAVMVSKAAAEPLTTVIVVRSSVNGSVESTESIGDRKLYSIAGESYEKASSCTSASFGIGDTGVFYLDLKGKIAYFDNAGDASYLYGVLSALDRSDSGVDPSIRTRIYTAQGEFKTFQFTDSPRINEEKKSIQKLGTDAVYTLLSNARGHVVRYKLNSAGEISDILFVYKDGTALKGETSKHSVVNSGDSFYYRNTIIDDRTAINTATTVIFSVPADPGDEDGYGLISPSIFDANTEYNNSYTAYAPQNTKANIANAVEIKDFSLEAQTPYATSFMVVTRVTTRLNGEMERVEYVEGLQNGGAVKYETDYVGFCADHQVKRGDVIRPWSSNGIVTGIEFVYSYDGSADETTLKYNKKDYWHSSQWTTSYRAVQVTVEEINGTYVKLRFDIEDENGYVVSSDYCIAALYKTAFYYKVTDGTKIGVETAAQSDLGEGDVIVARIVAMNVRDVIILR